MFRTKIENDGMLFVFETPVQCSFWMLFTPIALEAVFISADYTVNEIINMQPWSTEQKTPKEEAQFVLELPKGSCKKYGIVPKKSRISLEK